MRFPVSLRRSRCLLYRALIVAGLVVAPRLALAQPGSSAEDLEAARARDRLLAAVVSPTAPSPLDATDSQILSALGLTAATSPTVARSGANGAFGVFSSLGALRPIIGPSMLALSTGIAGATAPQPGTDFSPSGTSGDRARLTVSFTVPPGTTRLGFWYRFMSAEFPEFVGSQFNDLLSITVVRNGARLEVGRSSVNSALFAPASTFNAGGSGYEVPINGLPTGGLTRWIPVDVQVAAGPITLEFAIEDVGDGIYDSQLLVSSLGLAAVQTLDPHNTILRSGPGITTDVNVLATAGRPVRGAAADGVTKLLLRATPVNATGVRFSVVGGSPSDGGLSPVVGGSPQSEVTVDVVDTASGRLAFVLYHVPDDLRDAAAAERLVRVRATFLGGSEGTSDAVITLVRPMLVLMPGLWSNGKMAWGTAAIQSDQRFANRWTWFDYANAEAAFSTNSAAYKGFVLSALDMHRAAGFANTRVDLLGHSMGGVLARHYAQSNQYRRDDNYQQGDFNRLITVNAPHQGSPLANLVVNLHNTPIVGGGVDWVLAGTGHPYGPALEDLREGSGALHGIGKADVRGHALAGTGGSDLVEAAGAVGTLADLLLYVPQPPVTAAILKFLSFVADTLGLADDLLFDNRQHDLIVPLESQLGGMPTLRTETFGGLPALHNSATSAAAYTQEFVDLLNTPPASANFGPFPASGGNTSSHSLPRTPTVVNAPLPIGVSVSAQPTSTTPGGTVRVTITPAAGHAPSAVFVVAPGVSAIDESAPFVVDLTVPETHVGPFPISAMGRENGAFVGSNTMTVQVATSALLTSMSALPGQLVLTAINETGLVGVTGEYADGVTRPLTGTGLLTFASSNTNVAVVNAAGLITARGLGYATITASASGKSTSISVVVNPFATQVLPRAEAGPNQGVTPGTVVTLSGQALDVPSGLAPSYSWSQVAGPTPVALSSLTGPAPTFTPTVPGAYLFSLIVRAGLAESIPDNVEVLVGNAMGPVIVEPPRGLTVRRGETARFFVVANGIPTPAYQWEKNGTPIPGQVGSSISLPNAQVTDGGAYSVRVTNALNSVLAGPAVLSVCQFVTSETNLTVGGAGGSGALTLSTAAGCTWTATSNAQWLTVTSGASGSGTGTVAWTVAPSALPTARNATLTIGGVSVGIAQAPGVVLPVPPPPENLVAAQTGPVITLRWDAPAVGPVPLGYVVEVGTTPGGNELPPRATASAATTHVVTISSGAYYVRVRGYSANGQGAPSNEVRVSFGGAPAPPSPPANLRATVDGSRVTLDWSPSHPGHVATGFVLEAGTALNQSDLGVLPTGSQLPRLSAAGVPSGRYFLRVRGSNDSGVGAPSNEVALQVGQVTCVAAAEAPVLLSPTVAGTVVTLSWLPPSAGAGSYVVVAGSQPDLGDLAVFDTGSSSTSLGGPVPPGTYYVRVIARNGCGDSPASNEVTLVVGSAVPPPGRPVGLTATMAAGLLMLNWYPPATGGAVTDYILEVGSSSGGVDLAVASSGSPATTFSAAGAPSGQYFVRVRARNSAGIGASSNEIMILIP